MQTELAQHEAELASAGSNSQVHINLRNRISQCLDRYSQLLWQNCDGNQLTPTDTSMLQLLQLSGLGIPERVSISDLRRYMHDVSRTTAHNLDFVNPEVEQDLISLACNQSSQTRAYKLVESLTWRLITSVGD